ncbi:MAG: hypothetical protein JW768_14880 [Chitinispirillaceae bacterium]|nr:hypothetical protein [Chitinispirillaceae bacterium]
MADQKRDATMMNQQLISLSDEEAKDGRIFDKFERRLKRYLDDTCPMAGLFLRPEQEATTELLDWLELWTREYREAGKRLFIIPGTTRQFEALELSHPEQYLSYYSSLDDWEAAFPLEPVKEPAVQEPAPPEKPAPVREAEGACAAAPAQAPEIMSSLPFEPPSFFPTVETGNVVEISGEYECLGCGVQRTWLKGDVIERCDNVECLNPDAGWKLSCDLF